jgi:Ca-activated chloride channel family protein
MKPRMILSLLVAAGAAWSLWPSSLEATGAAQSPLTPPGAAASPDVRLLAPADGAYITGPTILRAQVDPPQAAGSVTFFVDGTEVCRRTHVPFECEWEAGTAIVSRQVRLVVTLRGGGRVVQTVRTASVSFAEKVDVDVVQVTATVTDDSGRYVDGLPRSAFQILEDGHPQTISHFYTDDAPLELVVALDLSTSMAPALTELKHAVSAFLRALPARHRLTLLGFNDDVFSLLPRTADTAEREQVVGSLSAWGMTALYEAVVRSAEILGPRPGRKAALVFTDGQDQGSHITLDHVERTLHASDLILYMVGLGRGTENQPLKQLMDRLSQPTGGRTISATSISALQRSFSDLLEEMSHQYVLGYQSSAGVSDDRWREIRVKVAGNYRVRARHGFRTYRSETATW